MKAILFGATGMIGQGVLRECLLDPSVDAVLTVGRTATGQKHDKLQELTHADMFDLTAIEPELAGYDVCFFCLGVSSAGMNEADYTRVTYDIAMAVARSLLRASPNIKLLFISGAGTDSTEKGRAMWARVKGRTENELMKMPFAAATMFRPAMIQPRHGITSRTTAYRIGYAVLWPVLPLMRVLLPSFVTTTDRLGRAMIETAKRAEGARIVENAEINRIAAEAAGSTSA